MADCPSSSDAVAAGASARAPSPERLGTTSDAVFRVLFSGIFLVSGFGHFHQADFMVQRLLNAPLASVATAVAPAPLLISVTGAVLLTGGLLLLLGFWTRTAALMLIAVLIPITGSVHLAPGPEHIGPLFKNIALLGGLVHFAIRGPGSFSLDQRQAIR